MALKAAMWVHGTIVEVEAPQRYFNVYRKGWGTEYEALTGEEYWFHFPIATPVMLDDVRTQLIKIFVFYRTDVNTKITKVHVYDGPTKVKAFEGLVLSGDHSAGIDSSNSWDIDPPIGILYGLGISVCAQFSWPGYMQYPKILFTTAGADFISS